MPRPQRTPVFNGPIDRQPFFAPPPNTHTGVPSRNLFATPAAAKPLSTNPAPHTDFVPRLASRSEYPDFNNTWLNTQAPLSKSAALSPIARVSPYPRNIDSPRMPDPSLSAKTSQWHSSFSDFPESDRPPVRTPRERSIFYSMLFLVLLVFCLHPKVYKYVDMHGRYSLGLPSFEESLTEEYCSYHLSPACIKYLNNRKYFNLTENVNKEIHNQKTKIELEISTVEGEIKRLLEAMRKEAAFKQDILTEEEITQQIREVTLEETGSILRGYLPELQVMIQKQYSLTLDLVKKKMDAMRYEDQMRYSETFESFTDSLFRELVHQLETLKTSKLKWIEESLVDIEQVILQDIRAQVDEQLEDSIRSMTTGDIVIDYSNALVDVKMIEAQLSVAYTLRQTISETNSLSDETLLHLSKNIIELEEKALHARNLLALAEEFVSEGELDSAVRSVADKIDFDGDETVVKNPVFIPQPVVMFQSVSKEPLASNLKSEAQSAPSEKDASFAHSYVRTRAEYTDDPYFNYAGAVHGGTILEYSRKKHSFLGLSLWGSLSKKNAVDNIINPSLQPGDCWVTPGPKVDVVIHLADSVAIGRVALSHTFSTILSESVPKEFQIIGLTDDGIQHDLGTFTFMNTSTIRQEFRVLNPNKKSFGRVLVRFLSNHGAASHSCIYYIEILNF